MQVQLCSQICCLHAGVGLVAFVDEHSGDAKSARNSLSGDLLCLVSSCFYAAYTIAIRVMLEDDEHASMMLFFGFVGLLNLVCLAPVLGALWAAAVVHVGQLTARMFALTVGKGVYVRPPLLALANTALRFLFSSHLSPWHKQSRILDY